VSKSRRNTTSITRTYLVLPQPYLPEGVPVLSIGEQHYYPGDRVTLDEATAAAVAALIAPEEVSDGED
jgi:hypothetical protein